MREPSSAATTENGTKTTWADSNIRGRSDLSFELYLRRKLYRAISLKVIRSCTAVTKVLCSRSGGMVPRLRGRRPTLSVRDTRRIFRAGRSGRFTARQVRDRNEVSFTVLRVKQLLHSAAHQNYTHRLRKPNLTLLHVHNRSAWAVPLLHCTVYSDAKRFCLDGPDRSSTTERTNDSIRVCFPVAKMARRFHGMGRLLIPWQAPSDLCWW